MSDERVSVRSQDPAYAADQLLWTGKKCTFSDSPGVSHAIRSMQTAL